MICWLLSSFRRIILGSTTKTLDYETLIYGSCGLVMWVCQYSCDLAAILFQDTVEIIIRHPTSISQDCGCQWQFIPQSPIAALTRLNNSVLHFTSFSNFHPSLPVALQTFHQLYLLLSTPHSVFSTVTTNLIIIILIATNFLSLFTSQYSAVSSFYTQVGWGVLNSSRCILWSLICWY